jgi:uncharacterized protein
VNKPTSEEEEYFAREDAVKKRKLAAEKAKDMATAEKDALKQQHWMRCPKCGMELQTIAFRDVQVDRCYSCNGTFLDEGELERLAGKDPGFMNKIVGIFKK